MTPNMLHVPFGAEAKWTESDPARQKEEFDMAHFKRSILMAGLSIIALTAPVAAQQTPAP